MASSSSSSTSGILPVDQSKNPGSYFFNKKTDAVAVIVAVAAIAIGYLILTGTGLPGGWIAGSATIGGGAILGTAAVVDFSRRHFSTSKSPQSKTQQPSSSKDPQITQQPQKGPQVIDDSPTIEESIVEITDMAVNDKVVAFYKKEENRYSAFLGNFHPCQIVYEGRTYQCTEAAFQAQKFIQNPKLNLQIKELILAELQNCNGQRAWVIANHTINDSRGPGYKDHALDSKSAAWQKGTVPLMAKLLRDKFERNEHLRPLLLATGNAYLIEHTARDAFWGDGIDPKTKQPGQNMLGRLLMDLRREWRTKLTGEDLPIPSKPENVNVIAEYQCRIPLPISH